MCSYARPVQAFHPAIRSFPKIPALWVYKSRHMWAQLLLASLHAQVLTPTSSPTNTSTELHMDVDVLSRVVSLEPGSSMIGHDGQSSSGQCTPNEEIYSSMERNGSAGSEDLNLNLGVLAAHIPAVRDQDALFALLDCKVR